MGGGYVGPDIPPGRYSEDPCFVTQPGACPHAGGSTDARKANPPASRRDSFVGPRRKIFRAAPSSAWLARLPRGQGEIAAHEVA